jgi:mannose-1-phosphate guanylyltransferase
MKAMLLAAGLGTRMAPLTPSWAKPTLPVLDEPILLRLVRSLAMQGIESIVVNAHQNAGVIEATLRESPLPVEFSLEPTLRGSGGGILHARRLLEGGGPFLVLNADMCMGLDVEDLLKAHARSQTSATLALRNDPRKEQFGTIGYDEDCLVCRITDLAAHGVETGCGLFTGAQAMDSTIFDEMPDRDEFDIIRDLYVPWIRAGRRIATWLQPARAIWWPVGSPRELLEANLSALQENLASGGPEARIASDARVDGQVHPPAWIGPGARIPRGARVGPRAVIGAGSELPESAEIEESLVLPGARPPRGALRRAIAFGERVWVDA